MELPDRKRLLLVGGPGSGKSQAILDMAVALPTILVFAFDPNDSIAPLVQKLGEYPPNLRLYREWPEGNLEMWQEFTELCAAIREEAKPGDWICFDDAGRWWELAVDAYIEEVFEQPATEVLQARAKEGHKKSLQEKGRPSHKPLGFGGLGPDDWVRVRGNYYLTIPKTLSGRYGTKNPPNVLVTALEKAPNPDETALPFQYQDAKAKPEGQNQLTAQVDIVLRLKHPARKKWTLETFGKNRSGVEFEATDYSDRALWSVLAEQAGWDEDVSPGYTASGRK